MCQKALYPGTFDPLTYGHIDLIQRAKKIFPDILVAVARNTQKETLFSVKERLEMLKQAVREMDGVSVVDFEGLVVDYARKNNISVIIRGIRMVSDFEYEFQMALTNRKFSCDVETIFLMPSEQYSYISSRLLKEAALLGADTSGFVPDYVQEMLAGKRLSLKK